MTIYLAIGNKKLITVASLLLLAPSNFYIEITNLGHDTRGDLVTVVIVELIRLP